MAKQFPAIIGYDISCNKTRRKVANTLKAWRIDGQYSLAECYLSYQEADELMLQLTSYLTKKTDSLILAWLQTPIQTSYIGKGFNSFNGELVVCRA